MDTDPPVPAGKQWVITHVSGRLPTTESHAHVRLQHRQIVALQLVKTAYFGPFSPVSNIMIGFSTAAYAVIEAGERAHVNAWHAEPEQLHRVRHAERLPDRCSLRGRGRKRERDLRPSGIVPEVVPGSLPGQRPEVED